MSCFKATGVVIQISWADALDDTAQS